MLSFFFINFGPIIFFYIVNLFGDLKMALLGAMVFVAAEFLWLRYNRIKPSFFFYFNSLMILVFGAFELIIQQPIFYKYEAPLANLVTALILGLTLLKEKSIVEEFAAAQGRVGGMHREDKSYFFRFYTILWTVYFLVKAVVYLYIGQSVNLEQAIVMRLAIGKISFWVMIFISAGLGRSVWKLFEKYKLFPSQRRITSL
ncbi:MAG: septation protein IspZ [Bdellovibrionaceae bacterium]|nr:septation protein IspZ [Bdellovibrio sp.]